MGEGKVSRQKREELIARSRQLRKEPTNAEAALWAKLRKRQLGGLKFRRQHIIRHFIVDFYCPKAKLVIEIDGPVHDEQEEYDKEREMMLQELGYGVLRFKNSAVDNNLEETIAEIYNACVKRIGFIEKNKHDKDGEI